MEMALACSLTNIQLTRINCVRMYLGVKYLSEICTPDGKSISPGVLNRTRDIDKYKTHLTRPNQPKPNSRSWDLWDRIILPKTHANNKTLIHPLQKWTNHHSKAGTWKAYMHSNGTVYTKNENNTMWSQYRKAGTQLHLIKDNLITIPTSDCYPTTVNILSNNKKYCDMAATIEVSQAERTRPRNTWEWVGANFVLLRHLRKSGRNQRDVKNTEVPHCHVRRIRKGFCHELWMGSMHTG